MPPEAIGLPATLYVYRTSIRVVAGKHSAEHPRRFERGARSILPEHRAQHLAAVSGKRGQLYLKRQHLLDLDPPALAFLTEVVHRRPNTWKRDVDALHELLQAHGESALRSAFEAACQQEVYGAEYIQVLLTAPDQAANGRQPA
jgi:hypothetical protein